MATVGFNLSLKAGFHRPHCWQHLGARMQILVDSSRGEAVSPLFLF